MAWHIMINGRLLETRLRFYISPNFTLRCVVKAAYRDLEGCDSCEMDVARDHRMSKNRLSYHRRTRTARTCNPALRSRSPLRLLRSLSFADYDISPYCEHYFDPGAL